MPGLCLGRATCCFRDSEQGADSPKDGTALGCEECMEPKASQGAWHLVVLYRYSRGTNILAGETQDVGGYQDREAWRAAVHGVTKSQTRLSD